VIASFERRLTLISAVVISGGFVAIVLGVALFAFSGYVGVLNRDVRDATTDVSRVLLRSAPPTDALVAGHSLAQGFFSPQILLSVIDERRRVEVYRTARTAPFTVEPTARNDVAREYPVHIAGRAAFALARIFGLQADRTLVGPLLVVTRIQPSALEEDVLHFLPFVLAALLAAILLGIVFARVLVHHAVRPLIEVTEALACFAAGDLTPRAIPGRVDHQLGDLTRAYNGAIDRLQRAFAERDRAQEAMRQFMSDAGHQLRTPLTVIRGFIGILVRGDLREPADRSRILATMSQQCALMASLIEKLILLDAWKYAERGPAPDAIDVSQLLEDVVMPIVEAHPARDVRVSVVPGALARIDPSDYSYAVTNLVDNALKYAPNGPIEITLDIDREHVRIVVADNGSGMSATEVEHAFDRFYRGPLHRDVAGSGLGLPIARSAIERAHGTLTVESAPNHGSRFTMLLPRASKTAEAALPVPVAAR
jgi:signal transduction histidine kinase